MPQQLLQCLMIPTRRMFNFLSMEMGYAGYVVERHDLFIYGAGDVPVLLVAHIDTVHKTGVTKCFRERDPFLPDPVISSPDGIGGDDRAGVWAILEILNRGHRPHILFTDEEETGCRGAKAAAAAMRPAPDVNLIIEIDRRGKDDACFYQCDNQDAVKYVESFGFKKEFGSSTDIKHLMPEWKIAGANLSAGYYSPHCAAEKICVPHTLLTVERVCRMLDDPPKELLPFVEYKPATRAYSHTSCRADRGGAYGGSCDDWRLKPCQVCTRLTSFSDWSWWGRPSILRVCQRCKLILDAAYEEGLKETVQLAKEKADAEKAERDAAAATAARSDEPLSPVEKELAKAIVDASQDPTKTQDDYGNQKTRQSCGQVGCCLDRAHHHNYFCD